MRADASTETDGPTLRLEPHLASVGAARHLVAPSLRSWGLAHLIDDVCLATSELVTNAVLHARTAIEVRLRREASGVRLEVHDQSERLPREGSPLALDAALDDLDALEAALASESMSGRGLLVVASIAEAWGADPEPGGKTVWARFATGLPAGEHAAAAWAGDLQAAVQQVAAEAAEVVDSAALPRRTVRLVAVPVRLVAESEANLEDVLREVQVLRAAGRSMPAPLPDALLHLVQELLELSAAPRQAARVAARSAASQGVRLLDIELSFAPAAPSGLWQLAGALEQLGDHSAQGALLSLAPRPEVTSFRRWLAGEIERQLRGLAPIACPFPVVPVGDPEVAGAMQAASDGLARRRSPADPDWARSLFRVLAGVATSTTPAEAVAAVLAGAVEGVSAHTGSVTKVDADGSTLRLLGHVGYADEVVSHWSTFSLTDDLPASECIRTGEPLLLRTRHEWLARYPLLLGRPVVGDACLALLPLHRPAGPPLGALVVGFSEERDLEHDRPFLLALADACAQALHRLDLEARERRRAEHTAVLRRASAELRTLPDGRACAARLAGVAAPLVADWCTVHVVPEAATPTTLVLTAVHHDDPAAARAVWEAEDRWPPSGRRISVHHAVLASAEPVLYQHVGDELLAEVAVDAEHLAYLRSLQLGSGFAVPLAVGRHVIGVLTGANHKGRLVEDDELRLAESLAVRAAGAMLALREAAR